MMDRTNATYRLERIGTTTVVYVYGSLDLDEIAAFESVVARAEASTKACVLSLEAVRYCPVRVVGIVIRLGRRLAARYGSLGIVLPRAPSARRTFEMAEATRHVRGFDTPAAAIAAARTGGN